MAFTPAIRDRNDRPDQFIALTTRAVIPGRVDRDEMTPDDGARLDAAIPLVVAPADAFDRQERQDRETLLPAKLPDAQQRAGEKALSAIDAAAGPHLAAWLSMINTEENAVRPKLPASPSPESRERLGRTLDALEALAHLKRRSQIVEGARLGDDDPFLAYEALAPAFVKADVLDERTTRHLLDVWLARHPERKRRRDSAQMALSLLQGVVDAARQFIESRMPSGAGTLITGTGRRVTRPATRASEPTQDLASRMLRLDATGNAVPLREVDETGNAVPVAPREE